MDQHLLLITIQIIKVLPSTTVENNLIFLIKTLRRGSSKMKKLYSGYIGTGLAALYIFDEVIFSTISLKHHTAFKVQHRKDETESYGNNASTVVIFYTNAHCS